jgi:sulfur-oxidizing protein SoxY
MRIVHPMDTGLVAGIPAFYLDELEFLSAEGVLLMRVQPFEPVSENPVFTLQQGAPGRVRTMGRDNNGNRFEAWIEP